MFLLATNDPKTLTGKAAELFALFPPQVDPPAPLLLMTASPGMVAAQAENIGYYRGHKELDFALLAAIRLLAARRLGARACVDFNAGLLRAAGLGEEELAGLPETGGDFSPAQRALLAFALKCLEQPAAVAAADIDALRGQGWSDTAIYDAAAHAAFMQVPATMLAAFSR